MVGYVYPSFIERVLTTGLDLETSTIKMMLLSSSYNYSTQHTTKADVSSYEISGTGYPTGGFALANKDVFIQDTTVIFDADDIDVTGANFEFQYAVLYKVGSSDNDSYLIACINFGTTQQVSSDITFKWATDGIILFVQE